MHNTIRVDSYEQNKFIEYDCFNMLKQSDSKIIEFKEYFDGFFLEAEYYQNVNNNRFAKFNRKFFLSKTKQHLEIIDNIESEIGTIVYANFIFNPEINLKLKKDNSFSANISNKTVNIIFEDEVSTKLSECYCSNSYKHKTLTTKISVNLKHPLNRKLTTVIELNEN